MGEWQRIVTPKMVFRWTYLNYPDKKYNKYSVTAEFVSKEDFESVLDGYRSFLKGTWAEGDGKTSWTDTTRKSGDKRLKLGEVLLPIFKKAEDGSVVIEAKTSRPPTLRDIKGVPYPEDSKPLIGGGSTGKLALSLRRGKDVISTYLNDVVLIGHVPFSNLFDSFDELGEGEAMAPLSDPADVNLADPDRVAATEAEAVDFSEGPSADEKEDDDDWC